MIIASDFQKWLEVFNVVQGTGPTPPFSFPLIGEYGGTGVANTGKTITIGGNLSTIGAFTSAFTMTANTAVTFPTSGTLATTATASGIVNSGLINQISYYAGAGTTLSGLATANNGLLVTSAAGVPSIGNAILADITIQGMSVGLGGGSVPTNTSVGYQALFSNTTGSNNVANGFQALYSNTTGGNNTANGVDTGRTIASGSVALTTGSFNTLLGHAASVNSATSTGVLALGANAVADIATGVASSDNGAGIAIGSALYKVGFRGDGTIYPGNMWRPRINGATYMIPLLADGSTSTGTGNLVLATSPTLVTPVLGAATGTSLALSGALSAASATVTTLTATAGTNLSTTSGNVLMGQSSTGNVSIGTAANTGKLYITHVNDLAVTPSAIHIHLPGIGGGSNVPQYGLRITGQSQNNASIMYGIHSFAKQGTSLTTYGIWGESGTTNSVTLGYGVAGKANFNSDATYLGGISAGVMPIGVYGETINSVGSINGATAAAGYFVNKSTLAANSFGVYINTTAGPTNIFPLRVDHAGVAILTVIPGGMILAKANGTEAANAVTTSGGTGRITTSSLTTAAGGTYVITWTNSLITATSMISLTVNGGTNTRYTTFRVVPGAGSATLTINNIDLINALNGTILIGYLVV